MTCGSQLRRLARFVTTGVPLKYPGDEALTHQPFSHASRSYQFTMGDSAAPSSIDLITLSTDLKKKAKPWPSNGARNSKRISACPLIRSTQSQLHDSLHQDVTKASS
ncbi:hypothetical protein EDB89DRAFT_2247693 [Lactarius sanguifluus]|nr:hypothetical protein EDB89DRAFT_2247693 [Lactarius sanguifluus]